MVGMYKDGSNMVDTTKNNVHVEGRVKRNARKNVVRPDLEILNFCLEVPSAGEDVFVDCFCTTKTCNMLEGAVDEGEMIGVDGFLTYRSYSDSMGRKKSGVVVYVTDAYGVE